MKTRILSTLLVLAMLLGMIYIAPMGASAADTDSGLTFLASEKTTYKYAQDKTMNVTPNTYEAWVTLPANYSSSGRPGVIIGSYSATGDTFSFELNSNRVPRIYWTASNTTQSINFDQVKVPVGQLTHVVIVRDTVNQKAYCYLNGVKQSQEITLGNALKDLSMQAPLLLGGDYRSGNDQYFKGAIKGVSLYTERLTAEQIASNYESKKPANVSSLICSHDLTGVTTSDLYIKDTSGNGYDIAKLGGGDHTFKAGEIYQAAKPIAKTPNAFEAWVKLPSGFTGRPGIILGTYGTASKPMINFELTSKAVPRFYWMTDNGNLADVQFSDVKSTDICTGSWVHIAITRDVANGKVHCYINGALKQSKDLGSTGAVDIVPIEPFGLGADYRITGDIQNFKGNIKSAAVYSTCLTAEQIAANYKASKPTGDATNSFICYYDLTKVPVGGNYAKDYSGNGYDLTKISTNPYLNADDPTKEELREFDYTFAVVGDTQTIVVKKPGNLHYVYDWLINNKEKEKLAFVMGVGDITDTTAGVDSEWQEAMEQILRLEEADIPFSIVRGNHDSADFFNRYYPYNEYKDTVSGAYNGSMANTYQKFTIRNRNFLVLALDCGPTDDMLAWAESVIVANPDYNVIITTHSYLYRDGTTHDSGDLWPVGNNNGEDLWQELVRKHSNIRLVLNGHDPVSRIITNQTAGDKGNIVTSMLIDGQYDDSNDIAAGGPGEGLVALLHFSEDSDEIQVEYVSTVKDKYFRACNQFSITLDLMEECDHNFVDGYCTECGEWDGETPVLLGANVVLNNSLAVNYYAKLPEAYKNAQMKFTMNGKETVVDAVYNEATGEYMFTFANIPPQCIGDNIKAELILGGEVVVEKDGYSVLKNAQNLLAKHSGDPKTANLVKAMLGYGTAAQKYANYKVDVLINAGYEMNLVTPLESVSVKGVQNNTGDATFTAAGVYFDSVNKLYVKIKANTKPTVTVNGAEALVEANGDGAWIVYTDGIYVVDFDNTYTFVITSNANAPTFTYSVNSYTYAKLTSDREGMAELAKATYTYGIAAEDYLNTNPSFTGDSLTFTSSNYKQPKGLETTPNTWEAWIYLPEYKRGVIFGNYGATGAGISFEINASGQPRFYWYLGTGSAESYHFNTKVPLKEWVHVAITRDVSAKKAYCYINGELKDTYTLTGQGLTDLPAMDAKAAHALGGDFRNPGKASYNEHYFKGSLKSIALYSTCLSADQIANNYRNGKPMDRSSLFCYYYLAFNTNDAYITDFSGHGYDIKK